MKLTSWKLIVLLIGLTGCGSGVQTVKLTSVETSKGGHGNEVVVLPESLMQSTNCQIVGKVFMEKKGSGFEPIRDEYIVKNLKESAQSIGGDILVGLHYSNYCGGEPTSRRKWASALVGKRGTESSGAKRASLGVAILPPSDISVDVDSTMRVEENMVVVGTAQYYLETAGYYAWPARTVTPITARSIKNNPPAELDTLGGPFAANILLIEWVVEGAATSPVPNTEGRFKASLFSKGSRSIVWEDSTARTFPTLSGALGLVTGGVFGIVNAFASNPRAQMLYKGMKELFENLRPPPDAVVSD